MQSWRSNFWYQATMATGTNKKVRELEIARRLASIFQRMPLAALHSIISNLVDGVQTEGAQQSRGRRWRVRENEKSLHLLPSPFVELELNPLDVIPLGQFL